VASADERFFPLLGVAAHAGRLFDASEARPGSAIPVAVVSFDFWTRRLGGTTPDGSTPVVLGDKTYRLIGVLPRGFSGIELDPVDVWLPFGISDFGRGTINGVVIPWYRTEMLRAMRVIGRPHRGTSDALLAERVSALLSQADDSNQRRRTALVQSIVPPTDSRRIEGTDTLLARLAAVSSFVLLIACANAVNLLLARSLRRRQEIAIRLAIGASRARLFRLLLLESVMLGLLGGGAAALGGAWTGDALRRLVFPDGRWTSPLLDERTILFTAILAALAGVAAGLVPAMQATKLDLLTALKESRTQARSTFGMTRGALVVLQTALSLVLLIAAGLLVMSLVRLNAEPIGFDPRGLVTASLESLGEDAPITPQQVAAKLPPGVAREVAFASIAPFGATASRSFKIPGSTYEPDSPREQPLTMAVSTNFFPVLGTRVVHGRGFTLQDTRGSELVTVVNESMARRYWGTSLPAGACILLEPLPCARVVGVVQDVRDTPGGAAAPMRYYTPLEQDLRGPRVLVLRTSPDQSSALAAQLRRSVPPTQRLTVEVIADRVARSMRPWRTSTALFLGLGLVALALACVGIYSVTSFVVAERRHEMGIRIALGAEPRDVIRLLLFGGLRLVGAGSAVGLVAAVAAGGVLRTLLFGVSPFEAPVYAAGATALLIAAVGAMLLPAVRAARVNPVVALRAD
jgi:predicted permease